MAEGFRWFGPEDPVPLGHIRQAGATVVFSSLHQVPYGAAWPRDLIRQRKDALANAGLRWEVVESVPVHEDIKTGRGDLKQLFHNYLESLQNLAFEGIFVVVYNFMSALDWVRTEMNHRLPDGSECMRFDPVKFAAFEIHALKRQNAEADYSAEQVRQAGIWWNRLANRDREAYVQSIIDVFPGVKWGLSLEDIRARLAAFHGMDEKSLRCNLARFLEAIVPAAERMGIRLAIHPDDPPFPVLGLPRIVSTASDVEALFKISSSPANGLCFCTGSFGARKDNDLPMMAARFAPRIHAVHLRNVQHEPDGSFFEADHLSGSVNMPAVMSALLGESDERRRLGRNDWQIPFRPDHGHTMMDDLGKPQGITPGYSCIGRMRGLSELRGLMHGLRHAQRIQAFKS